MIRTHIESNKISSVIGDDNPSEFNTWTNGNGSTGIALWNGNATGTVGYKYAFSGRGETWFAWGDSVGGTVVYSTGFTETAQERISGGYLHLPPYSTLVVRVGA